MSQEAQESAPSSDESIDLAALARTALKHWRLILAITAAVALVVSFIVLGQTRIYRAHATIKIEPSALRPLGRDVQTPGDSSNIYWTNKEYYETQYKILESRRVAEEVVQRLRLHHDAHFLRQVPADAPVEPLEKEVSVSDAALNLRSRITTTPVKNSRLVELSYEDADPARAQRVLTALAEVYMQQNLDSSVSSISTAAEWLNDQLDKLKAELESTELALHEYKKEKRLLSVSMDDQSNMLRSEMGQLNTALTTSRTKREQLAARVAQLTRIDAEDPSQLPASELLGSTTLQKLRENYIQSRTELESMKSAGRGENHPEVRSAASRMNTTRLALLEEVKNIQESYRRDLLAIEKEIAGLSSLYSQAEQRAFDLNLLEIEFKRLARARENTERLHSIVLERSKESELSGQMRFNNISVVDSPLLPNRPVKPRVPLIIALGAFGGLLLGLGFVLIRDRLDQRIQGPPDVEQLLHVTCLGVLPTIEADGAANTAPTYGRARRRRAKQGAETQSPELWTHYHPSSNVAEAVRTLRTNLVFMSPDQPFRRILVSSAGPTDGKTTVAASLAISLAQSGQKVLLLDGDLRKPRLHKVFRLPPQRGGVTSTLLHPETLDQALVETEVPGLHLLPAGPLPPNPAELLHSKSFERLLDLLSTKYDRIILDSPPLVPVTDAAILSRLADAALLVIRSKQTRKDHARLAYRSLRDVNAHIAGAVLNGVDLRSGDYGYYYQYYSYGEAAAPSETTSS